MKADSVAVYREATGELDRAGIPYALTGANALGAYTLPRATFDIDLLVGVPPRPLPEILRGLQLVERTKDVFFDQEAFVFEVSTFVTPVEMFVATHWLTREALERRRTARVPALGDVPAVRADDAALLKAAIAAHPARAHRRAMDADDLRRLRDAAPEIDIARMRERAARLGPAVAAILREAGFEV